MAHSTLPNLHRLYDEIKRGHIRVPNTRLVVMELEMVLAGRGVAGEGHGHPNMEMRERSFGVATRICPECKGPIR